VFVLKKIYFMAFITIIVCCLFIGCVGGTKDQQDPNTGEISNPKSLELYLSNDAVEISWEQPDENSSEIQSYEISLETQDLSSNKRLIKDLPATQTYYLFENITIDDNFEITVNPIPKDPVIYTSKKATIDSLEKEGVFVLFEGIVVDGENNTLSVQDVNITAGDITAKTDLNGQFQIYVPRTVEQISLNHTDYRKTILQKEILDELYTKNGVYIPSEDLLFLIQPIEVEEEVIAEEGAEVSDETGEVKVKVEPDSFDTDVKVSLSSPEKKNVDEEQNKALKSISLKITDSLNNNVSFKKPVLININFNNVNSNLPSRFYPEFVKNTPRISDAIRAVLNEADLEFLFTQTDADGQTKGANGSFDPETMNATILADSAGDFSLIPNINIPVGINNSDLTTSQNRNGALNCSVDLDIDVFSYDLVKKYFGGVLTANFEFEVYEKREETNVLIKKKILQRVFMSVSNIKPVFDITALTDVRTKFINDPSAKEGKGYEFFVDDGKLLDESISDIENDPVLSDFFSRVDDVLLLQEMEQDKKYLIKLRFKLATPFGKITHHFDLGSFTTEGQQENPPTSSKIINTSTTADSISLQWEECPDDDFDHYDVYIKQSGTLLPWKNVSTTSLNQMTMNQDMYEHFNQNREYSLQIYTYDEAGLYSTGLATKVTTKNKVPEKISVFPGQDENAITSGSVLLNWEVSNEPDFKKYVIYYEKKEDNPVAGFSENASKTEVELRSVNSFRIEDLQNETEYTFSVIVIDNGGESSDFNKTKITTAQYTPLVAPEIKFHEVKEISSNNYEITIYWKDHSTTEEGYRVYNSLSETVWEQPKNSYKFVETIPASPGYTYPFTVEVFRGKLKEKANTDIKIPEKVEKPTIPTVSSTTVTKDSISVNWQEDGNVDLYYVYISVDGYNWILKETLEANQIELLSLKPSTTYHIRIKAVNSGGSSEVKIEVKTDEPPPFTGPENVTVTAKSFDFVTLQWDQTQDTLSYYIYRKTNAEQALSPIGHTSGSNSNFTDSNVLPETTYTYEIRSYNPNRGGESDNNPSVNVTTEAAPSPPPAPVNLMAIYENDDADEEEYGHINISWEPADDTKIDTYKIEKKVIPDEGDIYLLTIQDIPSASLSYIDDGINGNNSYSYKIMGKNNNGDGDWTTYTDEIYVEDLSRPPTSPEINYPANNSDMVEPECPFAWSKSDDLNGDFSHYVLEINEATRITVDGRENTSYQVILKYNTQYQWKVYAYDNEGNFSVSQNASFKTKEKEKKTVFGQLSSINLKPDESGVLELIVINAKGLKEISLKLDYADAITSLELKNNNANVSSVSRTVKTFNIELESPLATDEEAVIAQFDVVAGVQTGTGLIEVSPDSLFYDEDREQMNHDIGDGNITVYRLKKGSVTISQEKERIMQGESIGINLNFSDISECASAVIEMTVNQPVQDYSLTNWNFLEGTTVATEVNADTIRIAISSLGNDLFDLTGDYQMRFLPENADVNYKFELNSVVIHVENGESLNSDLFGTAQTYCENHSLDITTVGNAPEGTTFEGSVKLTGPASMSDLDFAINFDTNHFEFDSVEIAQQYTNTKIATSTGSVQCTIQADEGVFISEGDLVTFKLNALREGNRIVQITEPAATYCVDGSENILFQPEGQLLTDTVNINVTKVQPVLEFSDVETKYNENYTVNLHFSHLPDLKSFDLFIDYDPQFSERVAVTTGEELASFMTISDVYTDEDMKELRITAAASSPVNLFDENLLTVTFKALNKGVDYLMIDPKTEFWNSSENRIEVDLNDTSRVEIQ